MLSLNLINQKCFVKWYFSEWGGQFFHGYKRNERPHLFGQLSRSLYYSAN
jgi:hypothetical protein